MSYTDATIHATQDIIYALHYPASVVPLFKIVNEHKQALIPIAEIFRKATLPSVPLRVPVKGHTKKDSNRRMKNKHKLKANPNQSQSPLHKI